MITEVRTLKTTWEPLWSCHSVELLHLKARRLQRVEEVNVKGEVGEAESGVDGFRGLPLKDFGAALGVRDAHTGKTLHKQVEEPARETPFAGLGVGNVSPGDPSGGDDTVGFTRGAAGDEIQECLGGVEPSAST